MGVARSRRQANGPAPRGGTRWPLRPMSGMASRQRCDREVRHLNRFLLSLKAFWRILTDVAFAQRVEPLFSPAPTGPDLRILAVLQRDGRLVDFLQEDI